MENKLKISNLEGKLSKLLIQIDNLNKGTLIFAFDFLSKVLKT